MKLNRKWLMVIALALSLTMAISGTLAYLTDRDTVVNTFTMGKVNIEVEEAFPEEGAPIKPGQTVNKDAMIKNTGTKDAWVWMTVSVPEGLKDYVTLNWTEQYAQTTNGPEVKDGEAVWTVLLNETLEPNANTGYILDSVTLSPYVDYQGGQYVVVSDNGSTVPLEGIVDGKMVVTVNGYAVQTDGLSTVAAAFEAYEGQWGASAPEDSGDPWDGTADTTWYNETDSEFTLTTAEQLAGLAELVAGEVTFAGKTIKLGNNLNLYCEDTTESADGDPLTFRPIGDKSKDGTFKGTFDGDGHTISNLYQNGWDLGYEWGKYGSYGLFGNVDNATIKNLTLVGGESYIEGGDVSFVAGSATGNCVFENITIKDSIAATYNNGCGGIIGWSGDGNYTFKNIEIANDAVLAGLWGSFDSSIGGVVGQGEPGATYNFENVNIACRIDAYNDCTASYDYYNYRMCGMIIGRLEETTTIDGTNYPDTSKYNITCNNVTVNYGDWMNYHYCDPTTSEYNNGRGMRVEAGYAYDGLPADYDHTQCTSHCKRLIPFDQIFGGDQLGVKGLKAYEGVNVIYPN